MPLIGPGSPSLVVGGTDYLNFVIGAVIVVTVENHWSEVEFAGAEDERVAIGAVVVLLPLALNNHALNTLELFPVFEVDVIIIWFFVG